MPLVGRAGPSFLIINPRTKFGGGDYFEKRTQPLPPFLPTYEPPSFHETNHSSVMERRKEALIEFFQLLVGKSGGRSF